MCAWKPGIWPALLALCAPAWCAEITSPADRDSITQQQKTLLEQAQQQREALQNNVELPALPLPVSAAAGAVCQPVRQIVFRAPNIFPGR